MEKKEGKKDWFFDIFMFLVYLFAVFYLTVIGVESIPELAEKWNNNIFVLFYALGVMATAIIIATKAIFTLLDGYDLYKVDELEKRIIKLENATQN